MFDWHIFNMGDFFFYLNFNTLHAHKVSSEAGGWVQCPHTHSHTPPGRRTRVKAPEPPDLNTEAVCASLLRVLLKKFGVCFAFFLFNLRVSSLSPTGGGFLGCSDFGGVFAPHFGSIMWWFVSGEARRLREGQAEVKLGSIPWTAEWLRHLLYFSSPLWVRNLRMFSGFITWRSASSARQVTLCLCFAPRVHGKLQLTCWGTPVRFTVRIFTGFYFFSSCINQFPACVPPRSAPVHPHGFTVCVSQL